MSINFTEGKMENDKDLASHAADLYKRRLERYQRQLKAIERGQPILLATLILTAIATTTVGWCMASALGVTWLPIMPIYVPIILLGLVVLVALVSYGVSHWEG